MLKQTNQKNLLAKISFAQGKLKNCLKYSQQNLETKSVDSLKTISELSQYLLSAGKFQEAYSMVTSTILQLTNYKSNNSLTFT